MLVHPAFDCPREPSFRDVPPDDGRQDQEVRPSAAGNTTKLPSSEYGHRFRQWRYSVARESSASSQFLAWSSSIDFRGEQRRGMVRSDVDSATIGHIDCRHAAVDTLPAPPSASVPRVHVGERCLRIEYGSAAGHTDRDNSKAAMSKEKNSIDRQIESCVQLNSGFLAEIYECVRAGSSSP